MKIGIITHYDVHNHGALLQLNALVQLTRKEGYASNALQFEKNYDFLGLENKAKYHISLKSIPIYIRYLISNGVKRTVFNFCKRSVLEKYKKNEELIGEYYTKSAYDAIIIGSDEVFALHTGPTPVFFGHGFSCKNVFSYAASFGPTTLDEVKNKGCLSLVKSGLESLHTISVRDKNSYDIIKTLTGKVADIVCDPVILYGYHDEIQKSNKIKLPPYLLIYSYDNNMNDKGEVQRIKEYAKSKKLKIVSAGFYHSWCDMNINVSPLELLSYFSNAHEVLTDTFHGSVLSIITKSEFAVIVRTNGNKLCNLLGEYGLLSRVIKTSIDEIFRSKIDYVFVNEEVDKRRDLSMTFLKKSFQKEL